MSFPSVRFVRFRRGVEFLPDNRRGSVVVATTRRKAERYEGNSRRNGIAKTTLSMTSSALSPLLIVGCTLSTRSALLSLVQRARIFSRPRPYTRPLASSRRGRIRVDVSSSLVPLRGLPALPLRVVCAHGRVGITSAGRREVRASERQPARCSSRVLCARNFRTGENLRLVLRRIARLSRNAPTYAGLLVDMNIGEG